MMGVDEANDLRDRLFDDWGLGACERLWRE
jgi:hypothetical protein